MNEDEKERKIWKSPERKEERHYQINQRRRKETMCQEPPKKIDKWKTKKQIFLEVAGDWALDMTKRL